MMALKLCSPFGADPITYNWPSCPGAIKDSKERAAAIVDTMKWVSDDFPALKLPLENNILSGYDCDDFDSMKALCVRFNKAITSMVNLYKGTSFWQRLSRRASRGLLKHIIHQVYCQSVPEPEKLNQYEPFSPEVYGETSYEFICQMIDEIDIKQDDVFIDLGSGIGQVVLQMAASTDCQTILGIEKADVPCTYAESMSENFKKWMRWFGKDFGEYQLIRGNFLDESFRKEINRANIIFVNNFAFGPEVDHQLKERFADLKDGARIISSKAFCSLNFRTTDRNLSDIGTIMHVTEMHTTHQSVSWTGKPVSYYLHVIDRTKLERYFQKLKEPSKVSCYSEGSGSEDEIRRNGENSNLTNGHYSDESDDTPLSERISIRKTKSSCAISDEDRKNVRNPRRNLRKRIRKNAEPPAQPTQEETSVKPKGKTTRKAKKKKRPVSHHPAIELLHNEIVREGPKPSINPGFTHYRSEEDVILPQSTYDSIDNLLLQYRNQLISSVVEMSKSHYIDYIRRELETEKLRNSELRAAKNKLQKSVDCLISEGKALLSDRLKELDVGSNIEDFQYYGTALTMANYNLRDNCNNLNKEIQQLTVINESLLQKRLAEVDELNLGPEVKAELLNCAKELSIKTEFFKSEKDEESWSKVPETSPL